MIDEETELLSARRGIHGTVATLLAAFAAALVGAFAISVETTSRAPARIEPAGLVREVQTEIAGRVSMVLVADGDRVVAAAPLVRLDDTAALAAVQRLRAMTAEAAEKLADLQILDAALGGEEARVALLGSGTSQALLVAPNMASPAGSSLAAARLREYMTEVTLLDHHRATAEARAETLAARTDQVAAALGFAQDRLARANTLVERGAMAETLQQEIEEEVATRSAELAVAEGEFAEATRAAAGIAAEKEHFIATAERARLTELADAVLTLRTLETELVVAERNLAATTLRAPISGVVDGIAETTVGATVDAFDRVAKVVPDGDVYVVRGQIPTSEAGLLRPGQPVRIDLDAFPAARFGFLHGTLGRIAADSALQVDAADGYTFSFTATLTLPPESSGLVVSSGMTATVTMVTGRRQLASYLFAPIVQVFQNGLGER
ncbi:MAG: HlyD family type I secretion periplasmic adaptor subunit [Paracoccaceae bacterium]